MSAVRAVLTALRLALPKLGVGWMFALLTSNFNQVAIKDLGITAAIVTLLLGMHYFLSPFQVVFGRLADRHPLFGLRRTPMFLAGSLLAALPFLALPSLAVAMGAGSVAATLAAFALIALFGVGIAASGDAHHALIAETTEERTRGAVIAVVWTFTIISGIASAIVIKVMLPEYNAAAMQSLYNLTPFVVLLSALLGIIGIEQRSENRGQGTANRSQEAELKTQNSKLKTPSVWALLRTDTQVRAFFAFVFLSIFAIFLQDAILEVFGRDVFAMTLAETTTFQQTWGGGVLVGMIVIGVVSSVFPLSKKLIATVGGAGTALGLGLLTICALTQQRALLNAALILMGLSTGLFNVGALSLMMDMTLEGATGLYMGLWGMAQAFATGLANIVSGALRTTLIETGLLDAALGYSVIFGFETVVMVVSIAVLRGVNIAAFRGVSRQDVTRAMETAVA